MPGCCVVAMLMFFGPRVALVIAWLLTDWFGAFDSIWVGLLGFLFLPWTSLAWMYTYFQHGGDLGGGYVLLFMLSLFMDVGVYGARRKQA